MGRLHRCISCIVLTEHRGLLTPILVYHDLDDGFLPHAPPVKKRRRRVTTYQQILQAVAAIRAVCNPHRAVQGVQARSQPKKPRRALRTRR
jgi:hypothetical protein